MAPPTRIDTSAVFDDGPMALLLIDPLGVIRRANRRFSELIGMPVDELEGLHSTSLGFPGDDHIVKEWLKGLIATNCRSLPPLESRMVRPDRSLVYVRSQPSVVRDEHGEVVWWIDHVEDIGAKMMAERELQRSEERLRRLLESLPDPIVRFDIDGRPLYGNAAAIDLFGDWTLEGGLRVDLPRSITDQLWATGTAAVRTGETCAVEFEFDVAGVPRFYRTRMVPSGIDELPMSSLMMVMTDLTDRRRAEAELALRATSDPLTGLANRAMFLTHTNEAIRHTAPGAAAAVLFFDIDRFKVVNDSLGHVVGDELLRALADRLRDEIGVGDGVPARFGGDEFTVLLRSVTDESDALARADRLAAAVARPVVAGGHEIVMTVSVGVAVAGGPHDDADDLLRRADAAMYRAKERGRCRSEVFDDELHAEVLKRLELDQQLRLAIERDELEVWYQPEVDLATGRVLGAEALVRWRHGDRVRAAGEFVGLAEETGLIVPIGTFVLGTACRDAARWRRDRPDLELMLRVNLSARQLDRDDLVELVESVLVESGLEPRLLCLELTETAVMTNAARAQEVLERLHRLGVRIAIDDFGTGYSSLSYLKRFPIDVLKIDRTFVDGLPIDADDVAIVSTIVRLAESLEMSVTGEGIESPEQAETLIRLGCHRGQGFHFARAVPLEVFRQLWDRRLGSEMVPGLAPAFTRDFSDV